MKIRVYALFLAFIISIPLLGMKRGLEPEISSAHQLVAHPGQADAQIALLDDCKALIVALCNPATRNVLMKVNKFYYFFASPRNIAKLLPLGLKLSFPDTIKELFSAVGLQNSTRAEYIFAQRPSLDPACTLMLSLYNKLFTVPDDVLKKFRALPYIANAGTLEKYHQSNGPTHWPPLCKAIASNSLPENETWSTFVEKNAQQSRLEEHTKILFFQAILNGNAECVKALINNKHVNTSLAKQIQQSAFWQRTFVHCLMCPNEAILDSVLLWLLAQRFDDNEGVHKTRLLTFLYEGALVTIQTNKHQILTRFLNHTKHVNELILKLLCYAYKYKKYDCVTTLLDYAQISSGEQPTTLDHHEHEYLRTYRQLLATLFPHNNQDISDDVTTSIVSLFKSFITADNTEYLGISLDTISMHPCFNRVATELLQYALVQKKDEYAHKILTYYDKLIETSIPRKTIPDNEMPLYRQWASIFKTLFQHDDTRMVCTIIQWIIKSAPIDHSGYLKNILAELVKNIINPSGTQLAHDILDTPRMQELEKILKVLQEVSSSSQECTLIINSYLSDYFCYALFWEKYHSMECLLNHGACPATSLQIDVMGFTAFMCRSDIIRLKQDRPELFQRLAAICQEQYSAFMRAQQLALLQAQNGWFNTLKTCIEQANLAAAQALLATWHGRAYIPVIERALTMVVARKSSLVEQIVQLQSSRASQSPSQVPSLRDQARQLEHIRALLAIKQTQCQYATN
jgi:hypothetical protein